MAYSIFIKGDLPYYLPFPEKCAFVPTEIGAQKYLLMIEHFQPLRHPDDTQGTGVDDRIGSYIKSRIIIEFKVNKKELDDNFSRIYTRKALRLTNKLIDSIRYYMSDFTIRPITHFDHFIIHRISKNQEIIGGSEGMDFGPFGITNQRIITEEQARNIAWYFTGLSPMNPARLLLLDAKYHNVMEDINRAILDIGIALEIHIEWLLNQYSYIESGLSELISDNNSIWNYYKAILATATGHSLLENEDLFMNLEYLRWLRNSVAHEWKPICKDSDFSKSDFISKHKERNYQIIDSKEQVEVLINMADEILLFTQNLFRKKFQI